ncbi:MAG: transporter, partial [Muribaculaceae bacterium]|nr:transporter [Muribaculaceae bacterium]
ALNVIIVLIIYFIEGGNTSISALVGIMSGAVTNTPGLAAAQQTVGNIEAENLMAMGYAAAYPLGVVGIIVAMFIIKAIFRIRVEDEIRQIEEYQENSQLKPYLMTIEVTNKLVDGMTIQKLHQIINCNFVVSRLMKADGSIVIPMSTTEVNLGDRLLTVLSATDKERFSALIGIESDVDLEEASPTNVVSRRILVTQPSYNGVTLGSLRLHNGYSLNATRVNRAGVDLLAEPGLRLQIGDRMTVVGPLEDIDRLAQKMGNSMKRLNQPNLITIFVGILFGILVGSINVGFGMKLGLAGGPLVVAILMSRFGYKFKLVTYTSTSASMMLREIGICLFLASVGISAGQVFVDTNPCPADIPTDARNRQI